MNGSFLFTTVKKQFDEIFDQSVNRYSAKSLNSEMDGEVAELVKKVFLLNIGSLRSAWIRPSTVFSKFGSKNGFAHEPQNDPPPKMISIYLGKTYLSISGKSTPLPHEPIHRDV